MIVAEVLLDGFGHIGKQFIEIEDGRSLSTHLLHNLQLASPPLRLLEQSSVLHGDGQAVGHCFHGHKIQLVEVVETATLQVQDTDHLATMFNGNAQLRFGEHFSQKARHVVRVLANVRSQPGSARPGHKAHDPFI